MIFFLHILQPYISSLSYEIANVTEGTFDVTHLLEFLKKNQLIVA